MTNSDAFNSWLDANMSDTTYTRREYLSSIMEKESLSPCLEMMISSNLEWAFWSGYVKGECDAIIRLATNEMSRDV